MQFKIFTIGVLDGETASDELNKFLRSNRILEVTKELVVIAGTAYWAFCVRYMEGESGGRKLNYPEKVDYKEILSEEDFAVFSAFRAVRKEIAQREAIPAYSIFTDAQLAQIIKLDQITPESVGSVKGVGIEKAKKYAPYFKKDT